MVTSAKGSCQRGDPCRGGASRSARPGEEQGTPAAMPSSPLFSVRKLSQVRRSLTQGHMASCPGGAARGHKGPHCPTKMGRKGTVKPQQTWDKEPWEAGAPQVRRNSSPKGHDLCPLLTHPPRISGAWRMFPEQVNGKPGAQTPKHACLPCSKTKSCREVTSWAVPLTAKAPAKPRDQVLTVTIL